jgi:hypothetical protein
MPSCSGRCFSNLVHPNKQVHTKKIEAMYEYRPFFTIFIFECNYGAITKACNGQGVLAGSTEAVNRRIVIIINFEERKI